jgi:xylan 1,4-beta-xylosidase
MNMAPQLKDAARGFAIVSGSAFKDLPIYITECDPEGCAACGMSTNPENAYRNGLMYSSYTAASFARIWDLAEKYHVHLKAAMSWSFEFEGQKLFDGFRDMATNGIDKPVLNVFRMYGMMRGRRVLLTGPDSSALAVAGDRQLAVMVWNYTDDDLPGEAASVNLRLVHLPVGKARLEQYRIDEMHSNAYAVWKKMGAPPSVQGDARRKLEEAGKLVMLPDPERVRISKDGETNLSILLPAHAVSLLVWKW